MNHSAFIYAFEAENIGVTGTGTLDGQADANTWWSWRAPGPQPSTRQAPARARLLELANRGVPVAERVFGEGHYLRPNFVQPYRSRNIVIEGVTKFTAGAWVSIVLMGAIIVTALRTRRYYVLTG